MKTIPHFRSRKKSLLFLSRRIKAGSLLYLALVFSLFACSLFGEKKQATLRLNVFFDASQPTAKARNPTSTAKRKNLTPSEPWTVSKYSVSGKGPGSAVFSKDSGNPQFVSSLDPGTWNLDIKALSAAGKALASKTIAANLEAGKINSLNVTLLPEKGSGSLCINIVRDFTSETGYTIEGGLTFLGLPGQDASGTPSLIPIVVPPEQASIRFDAVPAGYYILNLKLKRPDGSTAGGMADTVLILASYATSGTCSIRAGKPGLDFTLDIYPISPILPAAVSAEFVSSARRPLVPIGLLQTASVPDSEILPYWYFNGEPGGAARKILGNRGILPENAYGYYSTSELTDQNLVRADLIVRGNTSMRAGSLSTMVKRMNASEISRLTWRGSYDSTSATGSAFYSINPSTDAGAGVKADVRAIAASKDGLIVVSGLDKDNAVHAFATASKAELDCSADGAPAVLPVETAWIRLWRDEIKIDASAKTADRIAISENSDFIALASSSSSWLRVYALGKYGTIEGSADFIAPLSNEKPEFCDLRALAFSRDGKRLYVLSNNQEAVHVFSTERVSAGSLEYISKYSFDESGTESLSMQDLKVAADSTILASSSEASRIYLLEDNGGILTCRSILERSSADPSLYKPSCMTVSSSESRFFVLSDKATILAFERSAASGEYALKNSIPLPPGAQGASFLCLGEAPAGDIYPERVSMAGGSMMGIIFLRNDGTAGISEAVKADTEDSSGILNPSGLAYTRGAFLLAGRKTGTVSVFACMDEE